jgi:hypothetical protein
MAIRARPGVLAFAESDKLNEVFRHSTAAIRKHPSRSSGVLFRTLMPATAPVSGKHIEFTITDKNQPQKVGNIVVEFKGVDQKRDQAAILYTVDDRTNPERFAFVNQPIFFYESGTHQPEEVLGGPGRSASIV